MTATGRTFPVDWYFVPQTNPILVRNHFSSLNYRRPGVPAGVVGEVPSATRKWRDGSVPPQVNRENATFSRLGLASWYLDGAPDSFPAVQPLTWYGARAFPGPFNVGTFPPIATSLPMPTLTWTLHPVGADSSTPGLEWNWHSFGLNFLWANAAFPQYTPTSGGLWHCFNPTYVLFVTNDAFETFFPLRCTSFDPVTHISTWDDPRWGILGGVLTLNASPIPPEDLMLLATLTAAGSADLRFTGFSPSFQTYELQIDSLVPSVNAGGLRLQFTRDGGVSWLSANYSWSDWAFEPTGSGIESGVSVSAISFGGVDRGISSALSNGGVSATVRIVDPLSTVKNKLVYATRSFRGPSFGLRLAAGLLSGSYDVAGDAINGFRLIFDTGLISSGVVRVYGLAQ